MRVETILLAPDIARYGGQIKEMAGIDRIAEAARRIEALGFDGATTPETGNDPFLPLMIAAEHTRGITLGTNVAIAFPRSPMVVAQIAWDLQRFCGGRFLLGLGSQVKGHNERRYSTPWTSPPGHRLREYVLCLKAIFKTFQSGARPDFSGRYYQFTLMSPFFNPGPMENGRVPVYISALGAYMARLAGELCDGVRLHPLITRRYATKVLLPAIQAGARAAGRPLTDVDIVGTPFIVTGRNEAEVEAAKAPLKLQIAFYASTRTYHTVLDYHGWSEAGLRLHQMSVQGRWPEMASLVTDEMLEEFAVVATYDRLVPRLKERWGGVFSTTFLGLPPGVQSDDDLLRQVVRDLQRA